MKKNIVRIIVALCSGLFATLALILYQHFFPSQQSFAVWINGEKVVMSEQELQTQIGQLQNELLETKNELNDAKEKLNTTESKLVVTQKQLENDEKNQSTLEQAQIYVSENSLDKALILLNDVENKTGEIKLLIDNVTEQYESDIIEQVNDLINNNSLDEADALVSDALLILPDSKALKNKKQEISNIYPKNMVDVVPAYQWGGNTYTEYSSSQSGGGETFSMGGIEYANGMTFSADENIFNNISWAVYNLGGKYKQINFIVCHVDGTDTGRETSLQIFFDGVLKEEILLTPDMAPESVSLNVTDVSQLKMQVAPSGGNAPLYGIGNPVIQ